MVAVTLLSKFFGLYRDMLLAAHYGTTPAAVAFETASRLPLILFDLLVGGVITAAFIPIFNELLVREGRTAANDFANQYMSLIFLITAAVTLAAALLSPALVRLLAPDLDAETGRLAASLARLTAPMMVFAGFAYAFAGILQSLGEYNIPALMSLVSNGVLVLYFFTLNARFGIRGLAFALLLGWLLQAAVQIPRLRALGCRPRPARRLSSPYLWRSVKLGAALLVGSWTQPLCALLNTRFASALERGRAITALGYANKLYIVLVGVFSFVATNLLFPYLSKIVSDGRHGVAARLGGRALKLLWLIILPLSAGVVLLAGPVVELIYRRGSFTESDAALTADALRFLALGMPGMAANEIFTKIFYARQKNVPPMLSALASLLFNFLFLSFLAKPLGLCGIALSASLAVTVNALLNALFLRRGGDRLFGLRDFSDTACLLFGALATGGAAAFAYGRLLFLGTLPSLALAACFGALLYGALLLILPFSELKALKSKLFKRFRR